MSIILRINILSLVSIQLSIVAVRLYHHKTEASVCSLKENLNVDLGYIQFNTAN